MDNHLSTDYFRVFYRFVKISEISVKTKSALHELQELTGILEYNPFPHQLAAAEIRKRIKSQRVRFGVNRRGKHRLS